MVSEFLADDQIEALVSAIKKARAEQGLHRVPTSDGEAYAYQFNTEVYWHVQGPHNCNIAKGAVPLAHPGREHAVPLAEHARAKSR